jgi:CRISPR-associated exonuclease Cas4
MKVYNEEDFLNLAGIQHFAFCPRQWALIHIEKLWKDNLRTVEGELLHQKAHDGQAFEKRGDVLVTRGMPVFSSSLGINGICDVVEFHRNDDGIQLYGREGKFRPYPVEYKRGKPKDSNIDILQLAAQAMCLEEMLCCEIQEGSLFYGETRRRERVEFTLSVREEVKQTLKQMHHYYERKYTPKVRPSKVCRSCSLKDLCLPQLGDRQTVSDYIKKRVGEEG